MNRRRFLKYAGSTAAVVGASALGLDYLLKTQTTSLNQATTTVSKYNHPIVQFDYNPKYLNPTDQQTIQFTNHSTDLLSEPLTFRWLMDGQFVSSERDYSTKLAVGVHTVELEVSDPEAKKNVTDTITVEPDQIYPTKPLRIGYKGMRYTAADFGHRNLYPSLPNPDTDEMDEQLDTIRNELGCTAIIINGGIQHDDRLIECCQLAIQKGFERIYVQPIYIDEKPDQIVEELKSFAPKVGALRKISNALVLMMGHELGLDSYGIIPGETWGDRLRYQIEHTDWLDMVRAKLPSLFRDLIAVCKEKYGYEISYAAAIWEDDLVPWYDPVFESVGTDAYIFDSVGWTADWIINHLSQLKRFGKPVNSTEWGCDTFKGAANIAGVSPLYRQQSPYDESEQANYIAAYFDMLNMARITGCYWTTYNEDDPKGYGLYNETSRKKGFYMYKSYQRVS